MSERPDVLKEVKPTDLSHLPERFDLAHAVAFFCHDQLARLVVDLESTGALSVRFNLAEEADSLTNLNGEELWGWLDQHGYTDVINDLTYRQLTAAVVSDACHFLCESLLACAKGKTQVAYSLLRKPLKENLLLLEWLLVAPEEFLRRFHGQSIWPYLLNRLPKQERWEILRRASELASIPGVDADLLWTVRYAKHYPNSLETLWTKATHLVTCVEASATEPGNLNFVFSTPSAIEEQWEHYYRTVPLLLYYFVRIAEEAASKFVEWDAELRPTQLLLRHLAFLRYSEAYNFPEGSKRSVDVLDQLRDMGFECERCAEEVAVGSSGIDRFWLNAEIVCGGCGREYSLWDIVSGAR